MRCGTPGAKAHARRMLVRKCQHYLIKSLEAEGEEASSYFLKRAQAYERRIKEGFYEQADGEHGRQAGQHGADREGDDT